MNKLMRNSRCLALAVGALAMAWAVPAHGDTLQNLVMNHNGGAPVTAVSFFSVSIGSNSYVNFANSAPNGALDNTSFSITGFPIFGDGNTDVIDGKGNDDEGTFSMNVDLAHPSNDFLIEQIDFGTAGGGASTGLQTVFSSTKLLGFGDEGTPGEYWFAFQENSGGTSPYPIVGGLLQTSADIKVFGVSAPLPPASLTGMGLIVGLAGWRAARRFASKTA